MAELATERRGNDRGRALDKHWPALPKNSDQRYATCIVQSILGCTRGDTREPLRASTRRPSYLDACARLLCSKFSCLPACFFYRKNRSLHLSIVMDQSMIGTSAVTIWKAHSPCWRIHNKPEGDVVQICSG